MRQMFYVLFVTDSTFDSFTAFAFPKREVKQCVVKVMVMWDKCKFWYTLSRLPTIEQAKAELKAVLQRGQAYPYLPLSVNTSFLIRLSDKDLFFTKLWSDAIAIKEAHISDRWCDHVQNHD